MKERCDALALVVRQGHAGKIASSATRPKKRMVFMSIGYRVLSLRQASAVAYFECRCMTQRACGSRAWSRACRYQAVGSGASGRSASLILGIEQQKVAGTDSRKMPAARVDQEFRTVRARRRGSGGSRPTHAY
jgi:hypothetical protein